MPFGSGSALCGTQGNRWGAARAKPFLHPAQHFTCLSLTFLTGTLLKGLRVCNGLHTGNNGSHAALITPRMRVQELDQFSAPRAVWASGDVPRLRDSRRLVRFLVKHPYYSHHPKVGALILVLFAKTPKS